MLYIKINGGQKEMFTWRIFNTKNLMRNLQQFWVWKSIGLICVLLHHVEPDAIPL